MALFNWAFARKHGGEFVLRVEDTDQERSTEESEQTIYDALGWLGVEWDEGPDVGGPHAPYRQSEREYRAYADELLANGHAFRCFCTKERLDEMRRAQQANKQTTRYDGHCLTLQADEVERRVAAGEEHVVRMKVPEEGACVFVDELRGEISIPYEQIDMQVLLKADGMPTYHLAVVVDDHLMEITHVMRGEEWLNSVPKHQLLYEYFGWQMPVQIHLPLLRNPDQTKMSKRKNPTGINHYRDLGILPEALLNYLALMGWSMPDEREIFSKEEMAEAFDEQRISVRGPIFDLDKLRWMNGQHLRALSDEEYARIAAPWLETTERLDELVPMIKERVELLSEIAAKVDYLLGDRAAVGPDDFVFKKLGQDDVVQILQRTADALGALEAWEQEALFALGQSVSKELGYKFRDYNSALFVAVSGRPVALPLYDSYVYLGREQTLARLNDALQSLGVKPD